MNNIYLFVQLDIILEHTHIHTHRGFYVHTCTYWIMYCIQCQKGHMQTLLKSEIDTKNNLLVLLVKILLVLKR